MADFYQTGLVTTLHRMNPDGLARLEDDLERFKPALPIALVLPALYSEFETPAMVGIVRELSQVRYLHRIVVALGHANREQYGRAQQFFKDFRVPATISLDRGRAGPGSLSVAGRKRNTGRRGR